VHVRRALKSAASIPPRVAFVKCRLIMESMPPGYPAHSAFHIWVFSPRSLGACLSPSGKYPGVGGAPLARLRSEEPSARLCERAAHCRPAHESRVVPSRLSAWGLHRSLV